MISFHIISYDIIRYDMISYDMGAAKPHPWRLRAEKEKLFRKFCHWKMLVFWEMYKYKKSKKEPQENSVYFPYRIIANWYVFVKVMRHSVLWKCDFFSFLYKKKIFFLHKKKIFFSYREKISEFHAINIQKQCLKHDW